MLAGNVLGSRRKAASSYFELGKPNTTHLWTAVVTGKYHNVMLSHVFGLLVT
jgi:hypothetical protein